MIKQLSYEEIVAQLGRPNKSKGGYVYWRGTFDELDPDYPEASFQISNKDYRGFGDAAKKPRTDRENWFVVTNHSGGVRLLADELGGLARNVEPVS